MGMEMSALSEASDPSVPEAVAPAKVAVMGERNSVRASDLSPS